MHAYIRTCPQHTRIALTSLHLPTFHTQPFPLASLQQLDLPSSGPSAGFSSTSMLPSQPIPGPAAGPSTSKNETSSTRNHSGKKYAGTRRDKDEQDDDPPSEPRNFDQVRFGDYVVQTWYVYRCSNSCACNISVFSTQALGGI